MPTTFDQPLVSELFGSPWKAMASPYLPIVQPALESYSGALSAMNSMVPSSMSQSLGPAQIDPTKPQGPAGGKAPGALDSLIGFVGKALVAGGDGISSKMFGGSQSAK